MITREDRRLTRHYLLHWYRYESNVERLNPNQERLLKVLYKSLKELPADDIEFLADKYKVEGKPITDLKLAEMLDVDEKEIRKKRVAIQDELAFFIRENLKAYEGNDDKQSQINLVKTYCPHCLNAI